MNVLWIEDFGHLQPDSPTLINFFGGLIQPKIFDSHWGQETRWRELPAKLNEFFYNHSKIHALTLLRHYGDFLDLNSSGDLIRDHDLVAIDINLSRGVPKDVALPDGYIDSDAFHKKAGFYIYNQLIRMGFPDDNICFLTGEKESTFDEFANHCREALIPLPKAFGKDDAGMNDFRLWLDEHHKSDYIALRRGVIEGCNMIRARIPLEPGSIRFNKFIKSDSEAKAMSPEYICDYLSSLMRFLPLQNLVSNKDLSLLRLFSRAVVHEWDQKVNPHENATPVTRSWARVMQETRHYMAHGQALHKLTPQDSAYLFLVGMRAMFDLPQKPERYEAILLSILKQTRLPTIDQIEAALRDSYARLLDAFSRSKGGDQVSRSFRELANKADSCRVAGIDYVVLLYHILWHELAQTPKAYDVASFKYKGVVRNFGEEGSLLNELLKSTYGRLLSDCRRSAPDMNVGACS